MLQEFYPSNFTCWIIYFLKTTIKEGKERQNTEEAFDWNDNITG